MIVTMAKGNIQTKVDLDVLTIGQYLVLFSLGYRIQVQ